MLSPPLGNRSAESVKHRQLSLLWTQQQRDGTHTLPGLFSPRFSLAPGGIYDHPATITKGAEVASVSLTWGGDYRFDAVDKGQVPVDIDGGGTLGVRPSDLLPMALAGCSGVDVLNLLGAGSRRRHRNSRREPSAGGRKGEHPASLLHRCRRAPHPCRQRRSGSRLPMSVIRKPLPLLS